MVSGIVTAALLLLFVAGVVWLFVLRRAEDFDRISRLPLEDNASEERP